MAATRAAAVEELLVSRVDDSRRPTVELVVTPPTDLADDRLAPSAFRVRVGEEAPPVEVEHLAVEALDVVLLVDTSIGVAPLVEVREALAAFAASLPEARFTVLTAGGVPTAAPSSEPEAVAAAVAELAQAPRQFSRAAVSRAFDLPRADTARRVVIAFSGRSDQLATRALDAVGGRRGTADTVLHHVFLTPGSRGLKALAASSGGRSLEATSPAGLDEAFGDIASQLANEYRITFPVDAGVDEVTVEIGAGGEVGGWRHHQFDGGTAAVVDSRHEQLLDR
ncbi:MAG: hypothetical protein M3R01_00370, partial [Actinomycetota bacterium]|nr:hypothetical protein [Actinomycetota bacterium]